MIKSSTVILIAVITLCCLQTTTAQIKVENSHSVEFYIKNIFLGPGIEANNITQFGMIGGFGQFDADPDIVGVKSGLVMSTGNVDSIHGPNKSGGFTSFTEYPKDKALAKKVRKGDKDLIKLSHRTTNDIMVIEFDFVPLNNALEFKYIFASEEYPEYSGGAFNDVFGFFLSGPGIKKKINLAVLPDKKRTPVCINSINQRKNKEFFRLNNGKLNILQKIFYSKARKALLTKMYKYFEFDGLTTVLPIHYDVIPYQKYHIKLAIADGSDRVFDSAVFLQAGSFISYADTAGTYYSTLSKYETFTPNIDSILGKNIVLPVDTTKPTVVIEEKFEITDIYFATNSAIIGDSSKMKLDPLAEYLLKHKNLKCTLIGYTDNVGSKKYNQTLSEKRALTVKEYLQIKGISNNRVDYIGNSFENPKSDNTTETGRAVNRRVEITLEENE